MLLLGVKPWVKPRETVSLQPSQFINSLYKSRDDAK